jgi:hypothetical protein
MQNGRFVVLTGHLNDYPLSDLVGILRHQRKTGRLLIEYPKAPASFYFQEGELIDVQLGSLSGLQAICVALAQPASSFNFNPLARPSRRSIDNSLQKVVSELFGCWDESPLQIDVTETRNDLSGLEPVEPAIASQAERASIRGGEVLALPGFVQPPTNQSRTVLVMTAAGIMMLGLSSVIAVTGGFRNKAQSVAPAPLQVTGNTQTVAETVSEQRPASFLDSRKSAAEKTRALSPSVEQERSKSRGVSPAEQAANTADSTAAAGQTESKPVSAEDNNKASEVADNSQLIDVVMQIENGRVLQAAISNHKSGRGGYEAMALRIARQRRYPANTTGQETVRIRVAQPD